MSDICTKIVVLNPLNVPPIHLESDGTFLLDLDADYSLRLFKAIEELSDISKINVEGILGSSLPITPKNDIVLKRFVIAGIPDNDSKYLQVMVFIGSRIIRQKRLYVLHRRGKYEIELRTDQDHWLFKLQNKTIASIKLTEDKFLFSKNNIEDYNNLGGYQDGEIGVRFPLVNYGRWVDRKVTAPLLKPNKIGVPDLRPCFSALWILQKAFCEIGYTFRSTLLESEVGRRQISYILDKDFGADPALLDSRRFEAEVGTPIDWPKSMNYSSIPFDTEIFDPSDLYDPTNGWYKGAGICDLNTVVNVNIHRRVNQAGFEEFGFPLTVRICYTNNDGNFVAAEQTITVTWGDFNTLPDLQIKFEVSIQDFQIDTDTVAYVTFHMENADMYDSVDLTILNQTNYWSTPKKVFIVEGNEFFLNTLINPNYKVLDFLKGEIHKGNCKMHTDYVTREVWMNPPYKTKIWDDEIVDGYFIEDEYDDITNKMVKDSEGIENLKPNLNRYKLIKFKGQGDVAVKDLKLPETSPYLSYKVDYGDSYPEETDTSENPFYEVTVDKKYVDEDSYGVYMPHMIDNSDKKLSFEIGPRTLYWHGMDKCMAYTPTLRPQKIRMFGTLREDIPIAFMFSNALLASLGAVVSKINVAYGFHINPQQPVSTKLDWFHFFHQRWLYETSSNLTHEQLLLITQNDYQRYNFRRGVTYKSLGRTVYGRMVQINDFSTCDNISTPVKLVPTRQTYSSCLDLPNNGGDGDQECLGNAPLLVITRDGNCWTFSLGGTSQSIINSVVFEWKYIDDDVWTAATMVCDPTGTFEVRMIVDYEGCPDITRTRIVDACGNSPILKAMYNYSGNCFTVMIEGIISSPVESTLIEFSLDNGITWSEYTIGDCEPAISELILIRATLSYSDACPDSELETELVIPPVITDCSATDASVSCDRSGLPIKIGTVAGPVALDIVQYRIPPSEEWLVWNGIDNLECPFEMRRIIFYCNDECPTYCGPIILCECVPECLVTVEIQQSEPYESGEDELIDLTATLFDCTDLFVTYTWYKKIEGVWEEMIETTQTITVPFENSEYKVIILCSGCEATDEIEIIYECDEPVGDPQNLITCN